MKLYHGTSSRFLNAILKRGLHSRGSKKIGNWEKFPSRTDMVYLTVAYPFFFAACCTEKDEQSLVIEIDSDKLDQSLFYPDEDFIAQGLSHQLNVPIESIHHQITRGIKKYRQYWEKSLDGIGNCCYKGAIPLSAITRYCLFDAKQRPSIAICMMDPSISILNYTLIGKHKYRNLVAWMFGDAPRIITEWETLAGDSDQFKEYIEHWNKESLDKTGIEVVTLCDGDS